MRKSHMQMNKFSSVRGCPASMGGWLSSRNGAWRCQRQQEATGTEKLMQNLRVSLAGTERCSSWSGRGRWPMTGFSLLDIISLMPVPGKIPRHHFPSVLCRTTVLVLHAKEVPSTGQLSCILATQHPCFAWGISVGGPIWRKTSFLCTSGTQVPDFSWPLCHPARLFLHVLTPLVQPASSAPPTFPLENRDCYKAALEQQ